MTVITVTSDLCAKLDSRGDRDESHWGSFAFRRQGETHELVRGEQSAGASSDDGKTVGAFVCSIEVVRVEGSVVEGSSRRRVLDESACVELPDV